jgi:hypothetical protein
MFTDIKRMFMIKAVGEDIYPSSSSNNLAASVLQDATVTGYADMNSSDSTGSQLISNQVAMVTMKRNLLEENYLLECMKA